MSIKQQIEINGLKDRVEALERKMNILNEEPRKVAGKPDRTQPAPSKKAGKSDPVQSV